MLVAPGAGVVPAQPLWSAACKRAVEIVSDGVKHVHTSGDPALALGFTAAGHSAERVRAFLHEALAAGRRIEPMVESGNKYGVCARFHDVNAALVAEALRESDLCLGLSARDRARALRIFDVVFGHPEMRNRNVLHAGVLDSCVIGNLLNFPKHVFGFPFGSHATDGNEALSLCLYGYRQLWEAAEEARLGAERAAAGEGRVPVILYVRGSGCGGGSSSGSSSAKDDGGAAKSANDDAVEADALVNLRRCAARLGMALDTCASVADARLHGRRVAVVMAGLHHPDLDGLAKAARDVAANLHVHVLAHEWRAFFAAHASPVHMKVPEGVRSISIEEGLFCSGFAVYRDVTLRDMHLDVGYGWQAAYMSPNEGGSGASTPLFLDFCITMLGWSAIADLAKGGGGGTMLARERTTQTTAASTLGTASTHCRSLCPTLVPPFSSESYGRDHKEWKAGLSDGVFADMVSKTPPQVLKWDKPAATSPVIEWGTSCISGRRNACGGAADQTDWGQALAKTVSSTSSSAAAAAAAAAAADVSPSSKTVNPEERIGRRLTRANLEALLVHFQREFLGGKERALEVFSTGGGTRSINLAFEAVIANHKRYCDAHASKKPLRRRIKVITGNPHLAVERAERRFRFELIRMPREGALCPTKLKQAITDLDVVAIYTQTLSYTDGITDPLEEILDVVESENQRRAALSPPALPVTLINDCCLAFSVLVHNDGKEGRPSMRVLDLSRGCVTPILVTLDAHKHIGSDKGISTVIGTSGTLSVLKGKVKVGAQPGRNALLRAIACMRLMGRQAYIDAYGKLGDAVANVVRVVENAGMRLFHKSFRAGGSTVISVEDPSGLMSKKIGKRGHYVARVFGVAPEFPDRCQTGWQLSATPHALRWVAAGKQGEEGGDVGGRMALDIFLEDVVAAHKEVQKNAFMQKLWGLFPENSFFACLIGGNMDPYLLPLLQREGAGRAITQRVVRRFFTSSMDSGVVHTRRHRSPIVAVAKRALMMIVAMLVVRKARVLQWVLRAVRRALGLGR